MYKIIYSEKSKENVINIMNFIWNFSSTKVISAIKKTISLLEEFPEMWIEISEDEREIVEPKYKYQIRYAIIWQEIYILLIYKSNNIAWR